jgi:hypothetical protein
MTECNFLNPKPEEQEVIEDIIEKTIMIEFLNHYGWLQLKDNYSLNLFKMFKSTRSGLRMIYDSNVEHAFNHGIPKAISRKAKLCKKWLNSFPFC